MVSLASDDDDNIHTNDRAISIRVNTGVSAELAMILFAFLSYLSLLLVSHRQKVY